MNSSSLLTWRDTISIRQKVSSFHHLPTHDCSRLSHELSPQCWQRKHPCVIVITVQHRHNDNEVIAWNTSLSRCIRSWSFKDGLRWVSVGPWNPAARSSPSRISACLPRPRNNHRRYTMSAASSGNCRSSRGSSSLAVRLGRSVFARAPTKLSYFRAAIDSNRSDCCFAEQSPPFPAEKRTFF